MKEFSLYIKSFGCQMNDYDAVRIMKLMEDHGFKKATAYENASHILLLTCSVRQKAEDKAFSELGRINLIKKHHPELFLGVGGCLAQHYGKALIQQFPFIDLVFGTHQIRDLPKLLKIPKNGSKTVSIAMDNRRTLYPETPYAPDGENICAYVTIMQGCNNYCTYCIVPYVRGPEKSRHPDHILAEIKSLARAGIKEITLLGQNVNSYNNDKKNDGSFPDLLKKINAINGIERIRFITSHPKDLSEKLILSFKELEKLCEHIHLPLQSGSDRILKKMNRGYTRNEYLEKISSLRQTVPNISITSDIIVGFPGEQEDDFNLTLELVEKTTFDDLFIFHYTDRTGTRASVLDDKIPYETKIARLTRLNRRQQEISKTVNTGLVDKKVSVLFENKSKYGKGFIAGRTRSNKVVNCQADTRNIGSIREVKITKANIHSLNGTLLEEGF